MSSDLIEQAGAIVVRRINGASHVLLVRGSRPPRPWVFPKGHIEPGETAEAAAQRELREEAGVIGSLITRVGNSEFARGSERYRVMYYLFEPLSTNLVHEPREQRWFTQKD